MSEYGDTKNIDITGIDPAVILMMAHNNSRPLGMGFLQDRGPMSYETAKTITDEALSTGVDHNDVASFKGLGGRNKPGECHFDYVYGRPMKFSIKDNTIPDSWGYNRDNGSGALERIIEQARTYKKGQ